MRTALRHVLAGAAMLFLESGFIRLEYIDADTEELE